MPYVEIPLPARIGEHVLIHIETLTGQAALVVAWRATRHRFALGGRLDPAPEIALLVLTTQGDEHWLYQDEVMGFGVPTEMSVFLPFLAGDAVLVAPTWVPGEIRSWTVTNSQLETRIVYGIHLDGTSADDVIPVVATSLKPRYGAQESY